MKIKTLVVAASLIVAAAGIYDLFANGGKIFYEYGLSFLPH